MLTTVKDIVDKTGYAQTSIDGKKLTISVPKDKLYETAKFLRNYEPAPFDFLLDIIGMDYGNQGFGTIYMLSPTHKPDMLVALKTQTEDREEPEIFSVHDLWGSAILYEREVYDFFGIRFINNPDMRRLYLRSDWVGHPLRKDYNPDSAINPIPSENEDLDKMEEIPVIELHGGELYENYSKVFDEKEFVVNFGPQHPSTHGVLHLRVSLEGESIKKIDPNFGYIHRGIEKMCEGYTYPQILHLVDRMDYLSGTINRHAVCLCVENGLQLEVPQRAHYIRTIFDELTRIASHLLAWGAMTMDMGSITAFVYGMRDREKIMDIFEQTTGGRLMANYNVIGGVAMDIHPDFQRKIKEFIPYMRKMLREHHLLFTGNPIARGRMDGIGYMSLQEAISIGAGGPSGRASGWDHDVRKIEPYAAYDKVQYNSVVRSGGLTFDRYIARLDEIEESLKIIEQLIDNIPDGDFCTKTKAVIKLPEGEFFQRVEGARGEFDIYINSTGDKFPYRIKFRSPSLTLVHALQPTAVGSKVADLIMIGGSLDYVIPCIDR